MPIPRPAALKTLTDTEILALTLIGEAGGDHRDGSAVEEQIAVGSVIRNRLRDRRWPSTYADVCLQKWQFSCWNEGDPNRRRLLQLAFHVSQGTHYQLGVTWGESYYLADGIVRGVLQDRVRGANHYMTRVLFETKPPRWVRGETPVCQVGSHLFWRL